jgi:hypothetical protein
VPAAGGAEAVVGLGAAAGLAGAGFAPGAAVEAAAGAAAGVAAGFSAAVAALTALRHDPDSLLSFRCRHCSASTPPGVTLEQLAMKSERHDERIALFCASVIWASASAANTEIVTPSTAILLKKPEICLCFFMK